MSRLNSVLRVEIVVSEMTPPLGEAAPLPPAGAVGAHDVNAKPAVAAATTIADRALRRLRQATRIPVRFLSPATSMTASQVPLRVGTDTGSARSLPRRPMPGRLLVG